MTPDDVAVTFVAEHFAALLADRREVPAWYYDRSSLAFTIDGETKLYAPQEYFDAFGRTLEHSTVTVNNVKSVAGVAQSIFVTVEGSIVSDNSSRSFVLTATLLESDAQTFYVGSEHAFVCDAVNASVEDSADVAADDVPTPPSPPTSPQTGTPDPSKPELVGAKVADSKIADAKVADAKVSEAKEKTVPVVEPPKAAAPKATGWAAIAAAKRDQPVEPAPAKTKAQPLAPAKRESVPPSRVDVRPKEKEAPRKESRPPEYTAVFKTFGPLSDQEIISALPEKLRDCVAEIRNKSTEPTINRVWIEFTILGAVNIINDSGMQLSGRTVSAELPRIKKI